MVENIELNNDKHKKCNKKEEKKNNNYNLTSFVASPLSIIFWY